MKGAKKNFLIPIKNIFRSVAVMDVDVQDGDAVKRFKRVGNGQRKIVEVTKPADPDLMVPGVVTGRPHQGKRGNPFARGPAGFKGPARGQRGNIINLGKKKGVRIGEAPMIYGLPMVF